MMRLKVASWLGMLALVVAPASAARPGRPPAEVAPSPPLDPSAAISSDDRTLPALLSAAGRLGFELRAAGSYGAWRASFGTGPRPASDPLAGRRPWRPRDGAGPFANEPVSLATAYEAQFPHISYQAEATITASGGMLLAGWNDSWGLATPDEGIAGYGWSTDGGSTWVDGGGLPRFGRNVLYLGDPVVAHDNDGWFYYSTLMLDYGSSYANRDPLWGLAVARGRFLDGSFVWDTVVTAIADSLAVLDKEWIAVDPARGHVYLSYTRFSEDVPFGQIECIASRDRGLTWERPVVVAPGEYYVNHGSRPAVGPHGEVYVTWEYGYLDPPVSELRLRRSNDFARSFGPLRTVAKLDGEWRFPAPGHNRRVQHFPVIAVNRSPGRDRGDVVVAWNDAAPLVEGAWSGRLLEGQEADSAPVAQRVQPGDDVAGSLFHEADQDWYVFRLEQGDAVIARADAEWPVDPIAFLFCEDGEHTLAANNNDYGTTSAILEYVAQKSGDYYVAVVPNGFQALGDYVFRLRRATVDLAGAARDLGDILVSRSSDGGNTWTAPLRANDAPGYSLDIYPALACDARGGILVGWHDAREGVECDTRRGYWATYARRDLEFGPNFALSDTAVSWFGFNRIAPNFGDYTDMAADGLRFHAAWSDPRAGTPDIWTGSVVPFFLDKGPGRGEQIEAAPFAAGLGAPVPNPATSGASIGFGLAEAGHARLEVFDLAGRRVVALADGAALAAGRHARFWDLRAADGRRAPAGIYVVRLTTLRGTEARRLAVVR